MPMTTRGRHRQRHVAGLAGSILERLEARELLTLNVLGITPIVSSIFNGVVAKFAPGDVAGSLPDYQAFITWNSGATTPSVTKGTILPDPVPGYYDIVGTFTYPTYGPFNLAVHLIGSATATNGPASADGLATIAVLDAKPSVATPSFSPVAGSSFSGVVATFTDQGPDVAANFTATINWGDGITSVGSVMPTDNPHVFNVLGTHTYSGANFFLVTASVTSTGGTSGSASGTVQSVAPAAPASTIVATAGPTLTPATGLPFTALLATFTDANFPPGSAVSHFATTTVSWGDTTTTTASDTSDPSNLVAITYDPINQDYVVTGTHQYASPSPSNQPYPILITVTDDAATPATGAARTTATVSDPVLAASGVNLSPSPEAGHPFAGAVATFTDTDPYSKPSDFSATIDWGDNSSSPGMVSFGPSGGFLVTGTHTYLQGGSGAIFVSVTRTSNGQQAFATTPLAVGPASPQVRPISGGLAAISDTGASQSDGVTRIDQPTFVGAAQPYSLIQLYAQRAGVGNAVPLGQAISGADGTWSITAASPLADGQYAIVATVTPAGGSPLTTAPVSALTVDTQGPQVTGVVVEPGHKVRVTFHDELSGLDMTTLADSANFQLLGPGRSRVASSKAVLDFPQSVVVSLR